jgi:hypothetical protein
MATSTPSVPSPNPVLTSVLWDSVVGVRLGARTGIEIERLKEIQRPCQRQVLSVQVLTPKRNNPGKAALRQETPIETYENLDHHWRPLVTRTLPPSLGSPRNEVQPVSSF